MAPRLAGATQAEVWLAELPLGDGAAAAVAWHPLRGRCGCGNGPRSADVA